MEGVILFADDHINTDKSGEKELFESLRKEYPVLGVESLDHAEKALLTMSGFNAIILDWDFNSNNDNSPLDISDEIADEGIKVSKPALRENATMEFLRKNDFYTLIYIFSNVDVKAIFPEDLQKKFGKRIQFVLKGDLSDNKKMHEKIIEEITSWETNHLNLSIPIKWSNSINQSLQQIFNELASADINWIVNLYETASSDGVNPEIEVINLLQNLLAENLITKIDLLESIKSFVTNARKNTPILDNGNSIAKLFQRIYYTDLQTFSVEDVPIMTGDIFLIDEDQKSYGIIINPECDIQDICNEDLNFEMLTFKESKFSRNLFVDLFGQKNNKVNIDNSKIIERIHAIAKEKFTKLSAFSTPPALYSKVKKKTPILGEDGITSYKKDDFYEPVQDDILIKLFLNQFEILVNKHIANGIRVAINEQIHQENSTLLNELFHQAYNQTEKRIHLIPSFSFESKSANKTAVIDFRSGKIFKTFNEIKSQNLIRICKLNHPFIAELRQRYLSYYGRVGVPKIPTILREFNLNSLG